MRRANMAEQFLYEKIDVAKEFGMSIDVLCFIF